MSCYNEFAYVYDELMDTAPYGEWCAYIKETLERYGVSRPIRTCGVGNPLEQEKNLVVDLGCGTGKLTEMLFDEGFDVIGIDLSEDMLEVARDRAQENGKQILYLQQDMREMDLFCTAGTILSTCDSVNYITEPEELGEVFRRVNLFLYPGGLFIFDFNTTHKYRDVIGDTVIAENREDVSFIWENAYDEASGLNRYDLTLFLQDEDGRYDKSEEVHLQRGYTLEEMRGLLEQAGLRIVRCDDLERGCEADEASERITIVARESGKEKMAGNEKIDKK